MMVSQGRQMLIFLFGMAAGWTNESSASTVVAHTFAKLHDVVNRMFRSPRPMFSFGKVNYL